MKEIENGSFVLMQTLKGVWKNLKVLARCKTKTALLNSPKLPLIFLRFWKRVIVRLCQ